MFSEYGSYYLTCSDSGDYSAFGAFCEFDCKGKGGGKGKVKGNI